MISKHDSESFILETSHGDGYLTMTLVTDILWNQSFLKNRVLSQQNCSIKEAPQCRRLNIGPSEPSKLLPRSQSIKLILPR